MNGTAVSIHPSEVFAESLRIFFSPFRGNSNHAAQKSELARVAASNGRDNTATLPVLLSFVVYVVAGTSLFMVVLASGVVLQMCISTAIAAPIALKGLRVSHSAPPD